MRLRKKKTPKNSNKHRKTKEKQENIIILGIFLVFIAVVAYLFYFVNLSSDEVIVAVVNGEDITRNDLDWWYKVSVLPEFNEEVTKQDFLILSLIPQEVLVQQAEKEGIKATENDIDGLLGIFIIESGLNIDEFGKHLESRGLTIESIRRSFETRVLVNKLFEKENVDGDFDVNQNSLHEYVDNLIDNSEIEVFEENIEKLVLRSFEDTGDEACGEIRLYTTTKCEVCGESSKVFESWVDGRNAMHWSLDTGDNLLTSEKEKGIPKNEVELFKKYSPNNIIPTVVIGCKYKKVGKFSSEDQREFKAILKILGE
jgi:hypothetical protein